MEEEEKLRSTRVRVGRVDGARRVLEQSIGDALAIESRELQEGCFCCSEGGGDLGEDWSETSVGSLEKMKWGSSRTRNEEMRIGVLLLEPIYLSIYLTILLVCLGEGGGETMELLSKR
ncbi:putative germin-like protein 9-2 [Senna tora]|uniref:Putative germin-like protein 9-2 n=1 Tax=Senna tora TaxID=362788 RepID=A0A834SYF8_9FABA|nr:putative germin-like protein 9-2 [Senna tora]